jgi:DNA (cytosine-5)-methyltransferase 1
VLFDAPADQLSAASRKNEEEATTGKSPESARVANFFAIQHASIGRKPEAGPQAKGYRNDGETYTLDSRGSADAVCSTATGFRVRKTAGISNGLDSNRLRAIGNAVCVPIIEWIGSRIACLED